MSEQTASPDEPLTLRPEQGQRLSVVFLGLAGGGLALSLIGLALGEEMRKQFFFSYLVAYVFVIQIALGALFWVLLHHLVDAGWSVVVRRIAENIASILLYAAPLFLPILFGIGVLFKWTHEPHDEEMKKLLEGKAAYLNVPFFIVRAFCYFALWAWLAWRMITWSKEQDSTKDPALTRKMQGLSAPGMILLALTSALAGIDWIMSLDFTWFSTMFGVYFWAGAILSSIATIALLVVLLQRQGLLIRTITEEHLHDLGKLTFAFVIFWAYITFSQYFLTWYAAIPEETEWFANRRWVGHEPHPHLSNWHWVGVFVVFAHVIVPFLVLLPRTTKRVPAILGTVAGWLLAVHALELHWQIMPQSQAPGDQQFSPTWLDLTTLAALVGAGGFLALRPFRTLALVPVGDPRLQESLSFQNV
jgi:hypothetical protein